MSFALGRKSISALVGVHPDLVAVVQRAIVVTEVDFQVLEGRRTVERQRQLVAKGASATMNSRHITGHAVDLVPMVDFDGDGDLDLRWDWPLSYRVATAVKRAAQELNVPIRWGGVWDRALAEIGADPESAVAQYVLRRKKLGRRAFTDGPHFELPTSVYP